MRWSLLASEIPWLVPGSYSWSARLLAPGEVLWTEGEPASQIGVLARGHLDARVGAVSVGEAGHQEIIGEGAAFFQRTTRSATLTSAGWSWVLTLPTAELLVARRDGTPTYDSLLQQAVATLARRVCTADQRIARVATSAEPRPERDGLARRFLRQLAPVAVPGPRPPLVPLLADLPGLSGAPVDVLATLAQGWVAEAAEAGQTLIVEGDRPGTAWVVASGRVDVLRNTRDGGAVRLATLGPGATFGLLGEAAGAPRTASVIVTEPGWFYRHERPLPAEPTARRAWRECLLAAFAVQLRAANRGVSSPHPSARDLPGDPIGDPRRVLGELGFVSPEET